MINSIPSTKTERNHGIDIIRCCAILFVISGHFFSLHTAFRSSIFEGSSMFLQATINTLFQTGVPLFIMLTGCLNINKTINKKYYKGITKVLIPYLVFSIITLLFRDYYLHEELSIRNYVGMTLRFCGIPYGWYIEMWIGLFLLTPFLNILYKGIANQRHKLLFIGSLLTMTALPNFLNRYGLHIVPGYWEKCYPLAFYFIGAYIQEYKPQINKWAGIGIIVGISLINPVFNTLFVSNHTLIQICGDSMGVFGTPVAVIFFLLCYKANIKSKAIQQATTKIALLSLDMYLCSYIFDALYYPYFKEHYFINQSQFGMFFFIIVPLVFVSSFLMSWFRKTAHMVIFHTGHEIKR